MSGWGEWRVLGARVLDSAIPKRRVRVVREGRMWVRRVVAADAPTFADAAEQVAAELLLNATEHPRESRLPAPVLVRVSQSWSGERVMLVIVDEGGRGVPAVPLAQSVNPLSERGRGLLLVSGLVSNLTFTTSPAGSLVVTAVLG